VVSLGSPCSRIAVSRPSVSSIAAIHARTSPRDRRALAAGPDWSGLTGLEQLWPLLAERHGEAVALEAPHAASPETFSYRQLQRAIEQVAAGFASLGLAAGMGQRCSLKTAPAG
jgi:long-chain acyl-CoA synthetase